MTFLTLDQAKTHLRVDSSDEDALIARKLQAAELFAAEYLNRAIFVDQPAMDAAKAAVPAAMTAASTAYEAAIAAAKEIANCVEREMAEIAANEEYDAAQISAKRTYRGIVINELIEAAILLILGHLYENREDVIVGASVAQLPNGAQALLRQFRVGAGS